jgi:hypothetical protein
MKDSFLKKKVVDWMEELNYSLQSRFWSGYYLGHLGRIRWCFRIDGYTEKKKVYVGKEPIISKALVN